MAPGLLLLAFVFPLASLATAEWACASEDMACLAGAAAEGVDMNSMIQSSALASNKGVSISPDGTFDGAAAMFDMSHGMFNATQEGLANLSNGIANRSWKTKAMWACVSWAIYLVLALLIWTVCYPPPPVPSAAPGDIEDAKKTLEVGHFACLQSPEICICACFCPGLRWADTMNLIGFMKITMGLSVVFTCSLLNGLTGYGNYMVGPFTVLLALYYRHQLRAALGANAFTCGTCCIDALYLIFCPMCAIAQEARAVTNHLQKGS